MVRVRSSLLVFVFASTALACLHADNVRSVLDSTPGAGNFNTSVAIGTDGMPIISYRGVAGGSPAST